MKNTSSKDEEFMMLALAEAQKAFHIGEVPVGCIIVLNNRIVARAHNLREIKNDPTAHAEIIAIRKAAQKLKGWRLMDTTIYVTVEPCAMCAGAIYQSRIGRLVYGADDPKAGVIKSLFRILDNEGINHRVAVTGGVLQEECSEILSNFFRQNR